MAAPVDPFVSHCLELLESVGRPRARRMFGGHGLYVDELFVALIVGERLYLKVDDQTRAAFDAAACQPFVYRSADKDVALGYYSAPEDAMESPAQMRDWALRAMSAALRARSAVSAALRARGATQRRPAAKPAVKRRRARSGSS